MALNLEESPPPHKNHNKEESDVEGRGVRVFFVCV